MKRHKKSNGIARAVAALGALMVLVGGITFAALQSQKATVKGNTIQTATADLQVSSNGDAFSSSIDGYVFGNLIPGGAATPLNGYPLYLKNNGSTPLALTISVAQSITNPDGVSLNGVHVILTPIEGGAPLTFSLQDLVAASEHGGIALTPSSHMLAGQVAGYRMQFTMDSEAVYGPGASLSNIDFNFGANATV